MGKKVLGVVCGCLLGLLCFLFLNWIGWGIEVNKTLLFVCSFSPSLVVGAVCGWLADGSDYSKGWLIWQTVKTALITIVLGLVVSAVIGIYIMLAYSDPVEGLVLALFLGMMFGAASPVLIIIIGN